MSVPQNDKNTDLSKNAAIIEEGSESYLRTYCSTTFTIPIVNMLIGKIEGAYYNTVGLL